MPPAASPPPAPSSEREPAVAPGAPAPAAPAPAPIETTGPRPEPAPRLEAPTFTSEAEARGHLVSLIETHHQAEQEYFDARYQDKLHEYITPTRWWHAGTHIRNVSRSISNAGRWVGNQFERSVGLRQAFGEARHGKVAGGVIKALLGGGATAAMILGPGLGLATGALFAVGLKTGLKGITEISQSFRKDYRELKQHVTQAKQAFRDVRATGERGELDRATWGEIQLQVQRLHQASYALRGNALTHLAPGTREAGPRRPGLLDRERLMEGQLQLRAEQISTWGALGAMLLFGVPAGMQHYGGYEAAVKHGTETVASIQLPDGHRVMVNGLANIVQNQLAGAPASSLYADFIYNSGEYQKAMEFAAQSTWSLGDASQFLGIARHTVGNNPAVFTTIAQTMGSFAAGLAGHHLISSHERGKERARLARGAGQYEAGVRTRGHDLTPVIVPGPRGSDVIVPHPGSVHTGLATPASEDAIVMPPPPDVEPTASPTSPTPRPEPSPTPTPTPAPAPPTPADKLRNPDRGLLEDELERVESFLGAHDIREVTVNLTKFPGKPFEAVSKVGGREVPIWVTTAELLDQLNNELGEPAGGRGDRKGPTKKTVKLKVDPAKAAAIRELEGRREHVAIRVTERAAA